MILIISAASIFLYFSIFFIVGTIINNNSIVDIGWGIGFVLIAWVILFIDTKIILTQWLITMMVTLWGLRLFYHILKRNLGKPEDFRYQDFRKAWGKYVTVRAFFQVYMLQGLLMFIIALPYILIADVDNNINYYLFVFGIVVWIIGFLFEIIGDHQLKCFIKDSSNKGKLLMTGLWKYTRHPNYFGEAMMWWGLFLIAIASNVSWLAILSPITITCLLLFVSGIPILEKSMKKKPGYKEYMEKTSVFIPWFSKK